MTPTKAKQWEKETRAIKATQVAFDVGIEVQTCVKKMALDNHISPSSQIKKILDLPTHEKPVRPRLTISLTPNEFKVLAKRYNLPPTDTIKIKARAAQEVIDFVNQTQDNGD